MAGQIDGFFRLRCALRAGIYLGAALLAWPAFAAEDEGRRAALPVPVSINGLMVTLVDHSAHYIWDYADMAGQGPGFMTDQDWLTVEYYAVQLAAAAPLLTLGGSGDRDNAWADSPGWTSFARAMMDAALTAREAGRLQDEVLLKTASDRLVESCQGCHDAFRPELPTEGITHDPLYDHLYHLRLEGVGR